MKNAQLIEMNNTDLEKAAPAIFATTPHGDVSKKYSFVPTIDTVDILRDNGWFPVSAQQAPVRRGDKEGYQKHLIKFTRDDMRLNGEALQILLWNSHDRGSSFKLMAGIYRFVCANGMIVGDTKMQFSHKHIGFSADDFQESAKKLAGNAGVLSDQINQFKQIELTRPEKEVFADAARIVAYGDEAHIDVHELLYSRRWEDKKDTLWHTFNRVQENVMKGGAKIHRKDEETGRIRRRRARAVKSLDRDVKLNQALHTLTTRMAELKTS